MTALKERIAELIRAQGPISIAQYMQIALGDPFHGYYIARDPFGRDFVTAPEVSQIFGELIGLFFVQAWEDRGRPERFHFVELGPGRGTLMADMMRASAKVRPAFAEAARITFVETSPLLRATQKKALTGYAPHWALRFGEIPDDAPLYLMANEFFDALPIRQFVRGAPGWHEQMIALEGEHLSFALTPDTRPVPVLPPELLRAAPQGAVAEVNPGALVLIDEIAARIAQSDGVALIIDYGHAESGIGDTFQAMKGHAYVDPLQEPGEADLTAHVDFGALKEAARNAGTAVTGAVTQGSLLQGLGIDIRATRLKSAAPARDTEIDEAVKRLTGTGEMGQLFKAMALTKLGSNAPPGFPC